MSTYSHKPYSIPPSCIPCYYTPTATAVWQQGELGCLAWNDRQVVYLISTHTSVHITVSFDQQRDDDTVVTVTKPKAVHDYNLYRGKVDTVDQLRGNYSLGRKSMKNWPSLAWWLIDMCIVNAFHLFTVQTRGTAAQLDFRIQLMHQLAAAYPARRVHEQQHSPRHRGRPPRPHYPKHSPVRSILTRRRTAVLSGNLPVQFISTQATSTFVTSP